MYVFIRYNKNQGNAALYARIRSTTGSFWNFLTSSWSPIEVTDTKVFLSESSDSDPYESTYQTTVVAPSATDAPDGIVEVVLAATGEVKGQESLQSLRPSTEVVQVTGPTIAIPTMTGSVYSPSVKFGQKITVMKRDTPTITLNLSGNYSGGWEATFSMLIKGGTADKLITKPCVWVSESQGTCTVTLNQNDTNIPAVYDCSVKVTKGTSQLTVLRFGLTVAKDMI